MNVSDWLDLGAGFGMGITMSRALSDSFLNAMDARASLGAIAVPQTRQEIQTLLDKFDARLANGEISETLFLELIAKWQARLQNSL